MRGTYSRCSLHHLFNRPAYIAFPFMARVCSRFIRLDYEVGEGEAPAEPFRQISERCEWRLGGSLALPSVYKPQPSALDEYVDNAGAGLYTCCRELPAG